MSVTHTDLTADRIRSAPFCCYSEDNHGSCSGYKVWCDGDPANRHGFCGGRCNNIHDFKCSDGGEQCGAEEGRRAEPAPAPNPAPTGAPEGCGDLATTTGEEDCTDKLMFQWRKGDTVGFEPPSYRTNRARFQQTDHWRPIKDYRQEGYPSQCVAYVKYPRAVGTCDSFCTSIDKTCVWAQDDAQRQSQPLSNWLKNNDHQASKCTVRVTAKDNRVCHQKWHTQICACN